MSFEKFSALNVFLKYAEKNMLHKCIGEACYEAGRQDPGNASATSEHGTDTSVFYELDKVPSCK
jgi:hypothetical protein